MVADHQGGQHQGGVTPGLGPHSITFVPRTAPPAFWSPFSAPRRAVAFAHADDLNRKRNAADKTAGANQGGTAMLAEMFMLRLEAAARAAKEAANSSRFVPITLPTAKAS